MKKYIIYIGIMLGGLLLGYVIFGNSHSSEEASHSEAHEEHQLWTCSMHPQIMQPEPGDCPICGMELIPAKTDAQGLSPDQFRLTENALALANVQTTTLGAATEGENALSLSGTLETNESADAVQVSYFNGRIESLRVNFTGDQVLKGQLLATIYSPELYAAQQELITAAQLKGSQPKLYQAVKSKLKLWKISDAQIDRIESSGKIIENFPVYATVSGTVTEKLVELGDYVKQGQPLFKIANLNSLWAQFDVYESQLDFLKVGQAIRITTNAYPNLEFIGKVAFINPVLNAQTRTVDVRVELSNADKKLKPGMFVKGTVTIPTAIDATLSLPVSAVLWTGERSVVYVKPYPDQPIFEMREVTLGTKIGDQILVLEGLNPGEEVVTNGAFTIDAAAQLQGKTSMMNPNDSGQNMENSESNLEGIFDAEKLSIPERFKDALTHALHGYLAMKDALVASDAEQTAAFASDFNKNWKGLDATGLNAEAQAFWNDHQGKISSWMEEIANGTALEQQRQVLKDLSPTLAMIVYRFGINERLYYQFCPMADNNKGGYWLSAEKEIKNPYFGDAMLRCGEVTQIID